MPNKFDLDLKIPSHYSGSNEVLEKAKSIEVNEISAAANKVRKIVVRGVVKHGSPSNKQE